MCAILSDLLKVRCRKYVGFAVQQSVGRHDPLLKQARLTKIQTIRSRPVYTIVHARCCVTPDFDGAWHQDRHRRKSLRHKEHWTHHEA